MRLLIYAALACLLCGCFDDSNRDGNGKPTGSVASKTNIGALGIVQRYDDQEQLVTCWIARDNTGIAISCLPTRH